VTPELSVVLGACGGYPAVRRTVQRLKQQTVADRLELVMVAFDGPSEVPAEDAAPFLTVRTVKLPGRVPVGSANAAGVRAASAPIVAFGEDHCFPDPGWAEALLAAHRQPHAVVGPAFRNANPGSAVSWADFLIGYGPWMEPVEAGLRPFLPGHNSSYKRAELLAYGDRLEAMLESETVLHYELARRGRTLYLEPRARVAHLNFAQPPAWLAASFHNGRLFAGRRAGEWSVARRLFYAAASPLIPVVRFGRTVRELLRPGRPSRILLRVTPMLAAGLGADGLGQMLGYLAGPGTSALSLERYEYNRDRFLTREDQRRLLAADA